MTDTISLLTRLCYKVAKVSSPVLICLFLGYELGLMEVAFSCILIQWIAFIPSYILSTEKFYDITGTITYVGTTLYTLLTPSTSKSNLRQLIASALILIWTLRLGIFLLIRVHNLGKDSRFDKIKNIFVEFLFLWTIQGLWVFFCGLPVFLINRKQEQMAEMGTGYDYLGLSIYCIGLFIEWKADDQKYLFKLEKMKEKRGGKKSPSSLSSDFINRGLWKYSRHPNYFGEMLIWVGIYIFCLQEFSKPIDHICILSPLFIITLLTGVSAPMIEKQAEQRWGKNPDYINYKKSTPYLFPSPFLSKQKE